MPEKSRIVRVSARQIYSPREHPGVETTVVTESGATSVGFATAGISTGAFEAEVLYDGGPKWKGAGVTKACQNVMEVIGPAIMGMDTATQQREIDNIMLELDGTPRKSKLGANAIGSVSAAVLRSGAESQGIELYRHIQKVSGQGDGETFVLPVPAYTTVMGGRRFGGTERGGTKPTYTLICYDFERFSDAAYAGWETAREYFRLLWDKLGIESWRGCGMMPPGHIEHDSVLWELMAEAIANKGYEGKLGLQVDVAAECSWDKEKQVFVGVFSAEDKTRDDMIALYRKMVRDFPFVVLEDPLDEVDYEGHAILTKELGIQIVGDDLFSTNATRLQKGIEMGAANGVLLKVNQVGTVTEAFDTVKLAHDNGYCVIPCKSRGEHATIGDYAVGLGTGQIREEDTTGNVTNRLLEIEDTLGDKAKFLGKAAMKFKQ